MGWLRIVFPSRPNSARDYSRLGPLVEYFLTLKGIHSFKRVGRKNRLSIIYNSQPSQLLVLISNYFAKLLGTSFSEVMYIGRCMYDLCDLHAFNWQIMLLYANIKNTKHTSAFDELNCFKNYIHIHELWGGLDAKRRLVKGAR